MDSTRLTSFEVSNKADAPFEKESLDHLRKKTKEREGGKGKGRKGV